VKENLMAKNTAPKSAFPTQGQIAAPVNASGAPSGNTSLRPKGGAAGGMLDGATANHRQGTYEPHGAAFKIKATLYAPNAAEASATQRNLRIVPSAIGNRDFYAARAAASV
jgi:hypothetical protein